MCFIREDAVFFQATKEDIDDLILFCEKSKSQNTALKYKYAFNGRIKWCSSRRPPVLNFPASDFHVSLYLVHVSKEHNSMAKVNEASYAISWAHDLSGVKIPCHSSLVISVKEGAHRCTAHPVSKKEPISPGTLQKIAKRFVTSTYNLPDLRIAYMCVLSFAAFLRFSELVNLRRSIIDFHEEYFTLYVAKSKTDKHKQGSHVNKSKRVNVLVHMKC